MTNEIEKGGSRGGAQKYNSTEQLVTELTGRKLSHHSLSQE